VARTQGRRQLTARRVTLSDVATAAQVSEMTVSRVVNDSTDVSDGTRQRVQKMMAQLGYVPNQLARGLAVGGTRTIGLLVPDITHPWFTQIAHTIESMASEHGYTVLFGNSDGRASIEQGYVERFAAYRVDAMILAPAGDGAAASLRMLSESGVRFVLLDRSVRGFQADLVAGESVHAAELLTEHVLGEHGYQDIALVGGPRGVSTARERVRGFTATCRRYGIDGDRMTVIHGNYTREAGAAAGRALLTGPRPPRVVVAANSAIAFGVLEAARDLGVTVPEQLALVTFDDVETSAVTPFLTCVERPPREVAQRAIELVLRRLAGDDSGLTRTFVPAELRIRRSCGCGDHDR
jgi:LacI family transcriptional regulator